MNRISKGIIAAIVVSSMAGCDTVSELTFREEQIIEIAPVGFVAKRCTNRSEDANASLRLTVMTSFDAPLVPNKRYGSLGDPLVPGGNFGAANFAFGDGWFFIANADGSDKTCETADDCVVNGARIADAVCVTPSEMGLSSYYYAPTRVCAIATQIETVSAPRFTHYAENLLPGNENVSTQNANGRSFAFMLDNSATLDGSQETGVPTQTLATDPYQYRKVGLNAFMDGIAFNGNQSDRVEYAAVFANGTAATGVYDMTPEWLRTEALWNAKVMHFYPSPSGGSPLWTASTTTLEKVTQKATSTYRKSMIALSDGTADDDAAKSAWMTQMTAAGISGVDLYWIDVRPKGDMDESLGYAQSVALGCGNYFIFESPSQISAVMKSIALNTQSHWDIDVKFSHKPPVGTLSRLATNLVVTLGTSAVAYEAQRQVGQSDLTTETTDNRFVFIP